MIIGSLSGWLMLAGMIARPRATSSRTNSGVITEGMLAPHDWPGCWVTPPPCPFREASSRATSRRLVFPDRNELHLRRDDALSGVVDLGHVHAWFGPERLTNVLKPEFVQLGIGRAQATIMGRDICKFNDIVPADHPVPSVGCQSSPSVDCDGRVCVGAGGIIDRDRFIGDGRDPRSSTWWQSN